MGSTTDNVVFLVKYAAFLRVNEYITKSPAKNPRIVDTIKVIVTPMARVTPLDSVVAVRAVRIGNKINIGITT